MCIRITKELKATYEKDLGIDLGFKIGFDLFLRILMVMGYVNQMVDQATGETVPKMTK